tara:strand:- start:115 stop:261 length:147 start_codon:yes stop_codon:yes gene_type:complete
MNQLKAVLPFVAAFCIYFLVLNSPMYKQMKQNHSVEIEIKAIPVDGFK